MPPSEAGDAIGEANACEYPNAFQLFPVIQYLANSVATQTNGAASIATDPDRRSRNASSPAKAAGNSPAAAATQKKKK